MSRIGISKNNFSKVQPCTVEMLNEAFDSANVKNVCDNIAQKLEAVKKGEATRAEFDDYKTAMKKQSNCPCLLHTPSLRMVNARTQKPFPLDSRCTTSTTLRIHAVTITQ